jgi:hypothetical protein
MANNIFTLSGDDIKILRQVVDAERKKITRNIPQKIEKPILLRGVYIASPIETVPGASDSTELRPYSFKVYGFKNLDENASNDESKRWQLDEIKYGDSDGDPFVIDAFNISDSELSSDEKYVLAQDSWGNWIALISEGGTESPVKPTELTGILQTPLVMIRLDRDYITYKNHQLQLRDSMSDKGQSSNYSLAKLLSRAVGRVRIDGGASEKIETWQAGEKGLEPKQSPLGQELLRYDVPNNAISGDYINCYHKRGENKYQIVNGKVEPIYEKKRLSAKIFDKYAAMRTIELSEYYNEGEDDDDGEGENDNGKDDEVYPLFFKTIKTDKNLIHDPQCLCFSGMAESEYLLPGDMVDIKDTIDIVVPDSFLYDEYNYPIPKHYAGITDKEENLPDKWWVSQVPPQYSQNAVEWAREQHFIAFVGNPRFETLTAYLLNPRTGANRDRWTSYNFEKTDDHKKGDQIIASQIRIVEPHDSRYSVSIVGQVDIEKSDEKAQVELFFNRVTNNSSSNQSLDGELIKIVSASEFATDRDEIIDDIVGEDEEDEDGGDDSNQQIKILRNSLTLYYVIGALPETTSIGNCGCDSTVLGVYTRKGSDNIDYLLVLDSSYLPIGYALRGEEITCSYPGVTGQCSPKRRKINYTMERIPSSSGTFQLQITSGVCAVPCTFVAPPK